MRTAIFDIETFGLNADTALILCASIKSYGHNGITTIRADAFDAWGKRRYDNRPICEAINAALRDYDIFVAHNGVDFDRKMLTSFAIRFDFPPFLRFSKFVDPVQLARRHMRLGRNSLTNLLQWLDIEESKTTIKWDNWRRAAYGGETESMDKIVQHCEQDVRVLERAYDKMRKLVRDIRDNGSAY